MRLFFLFFLLILSANAASVVLVNNRGGNETFYLQGAWGQTAIALNARQQVVFDLGEQMAAISVSSAGAPALQSVDFSVGRVALVSNSSSGSQLYVGMTGGSQSDAEATEYYEVFVKGFVVGLGWEIFGLIIALVRRLRTGTGME